MGHYYHQFDSKECAVCGVSPAIICPGLEDHGMPAVCLICRGLNDAENLGPHVSSNTGEPVIRLWSNTEVDENLVNQEKLLKGEP